MKKKFLVIVIHLFTASGVFAQSMLKVSSIERAPITVALDGRHFQKHGESITVGDVPPGRHYLKIYSYELTKRGYEREELLYEGRVNTVDGRVTVFVLDEENGRADVQMQEINGYNNTPENENNALPPQNEGNGVPDKSATTNYEAPNNQNSVNSSLPPNQPLASPVTPDKIVTLTIKKIDKLKKKADAKGTDTEKLKIIKAGLTKEKYYSTQVAEIMDWLIFESSKVDLAKAGYGNVVDKDNYYNTLSVKFNYKNSQEELSKYITEYK